MSKSAKLEEESSSKSKTKVIKTKRSIGEFEEDHVSLDLLKGNYFLAGLRYPFMGISFFFSRCLILSILPELCCIFLPCACLLLFLISIGGFYAFYVVYGSTTDVPFFVGLAPIPLIQFPIFCIVCLLCSFCFNMSTKIIRTSDRSVRGKCYTPCQNMCCDPFCCFFFCCFYCALSCEFPITLVLCIFACSVPILGPCLLFPLLCILLVGSWCLRTNYIYRCACCKWPYFAIKHLQVIFGFGIGGILVSFIPLIGPLSVLGSAQMLIRHLRYVEIDLKRKKNTVTPISTKSTSKSSDEKEEETTQEEEELDPNVEKELDDMAKTKEKEFRENEEIVVSSIVSNTTGHGRRKNPYSLEVGVVVDSLGDDEEFDVEQEKADLMEDMGIDIPMSPDSGIIRTIQSDKLEKKIGKDGDGSFTRYEFVESPTEKESDF